MKTALICGVNGQDGAYLAQFLLAKGYRVIGTSRDASAGRMGNLQQLNIEGAIELASMAMDNFQDVLRVLTTACPDEVYNLAGQSSVGLSFEQPVETMKSIATGSLNMLEAVRSLGCGIRLFSAGSSECFGDIGRLPACERTPFRPGSPYAVAKTCAANLVSTYREAYGLFACTGILFGHESPLRPRRFVTRKIIEAAANIHAGLQSKVTLGNLAVSRDWGWAPDYVEAMWLMLQRESALDMVIATGRTVSLEYFVQAAFTHFGLDWELHVVQDPTLLRPTDISYSAADVSLAKSELGWTASHSVDDVVRLLCEAESHRLTR